MIEIVLRVFVDQNVIWTITYCGKSKPFFFSCIIYNFKSFTFFFLIKDIKKWFFFVNTYSTFSSFFSAKLEPSNTFVPPPPSPMFTNQTPFLPLHTTPLRLHLPFRPHLDLTSPTIHHSPPPRLTAPFYGRCEDGTRGKGTQLTVRM